MYRLMISPVSKTDSYGVSCLSQEFYLKDSQTVCDVINRLNGSGCLFTLCEVHFSTVTEIVEKIEKNKM